MIRIKHAVLVVSSALTMVMAGLIATQPAYASVTQSHCAGDTCLIISRNTSTGKTVYTATVEFLNPSIPTTVSYHYHGYKSNGIETGPQHDSGAIICSEVICTKKWTINFTYKSGNFIVGYTVVSGVEEGSPSFDF